MDTKREKVESDGVKGKALKLKSKLIVFEWRAWIGLLVGEETRSTEPPTSLDGLAYHHKTWTTFSHVHGT